MVMNKGRGQVQYQSSQYAPVQVYTAEEVSEFADDGVVFETLSIDGQRKFVRRLVSGTVSLYKNRRQFLLRKDTALTLLTRRNYTSVINASLQCDGESRPAPVLRYSKGVLTRVTEAYNYGDCDFSDFPYRMHGFAAALNVVNFRTDFGGGLVVQNTVSTPTIVFFSHHPLIKPRSLYMTFDVSWMYSEPEFFHETPRATNYLPLTINGVNSSGGLKWIIGDGSILPSIRTGAIVSFLEISSPTGHIATFSDGTGVEVSKHDLTKSTELFYGFYTGIGAEKRLGTRKKLHLELRYVQSAKTDFGFFRLDFSGFSILAGLSL